jgi:hypothetical protein
MDIVQPALRAGDKVDAVEAAVGFLATTVEEYAQCIIKLLCMSASQRMSMAQAGRERSRMFSCDSFRANWLQNIAQVM